MRSKHSGRRGDMKKPKKGEELYERYNLSGKTVIVTGGSSGIGRAVALDFANFDANTVIADVAPGERVVTEIESMGRKALYVKTDVSSQREVKTLAEAALGKFKSIDILVNCAAILSRCKITEIAEEDWDRVMDINLKGIFLCSKAVAPYMMRQKKGKIINIGSASSRGPVLNMTQGGADYCISKSGVHALTRVLAWELAPYGINVNTIAPGPVDTPMHKGEMKMIREKYLSKVPMKRLGKPQDIANVILFLATDAASYITGQAIHVNGGMLMVD
jgi:3-oxoacyl-[acyl-carrier protein] reductase